MNKAKLFFYGVCLVSAYLAFNIMKTGQVPGTLAPKNNDYTLDNPARAVKYSVPLKCSLNHVTVVSTEEAGPVQGSNYMASYKSIIQTDDGLKYPVFLLTDGVTDPWAAGQRFALIGTCEVIDSQILASVRAQYKDDIQVKENECVGALYWDTKLHQVSRQCGQGLGDYFYLGWDNKPQAPAQK